MRLILVAATMASLPDLSALESAIGLTPAATPPVQAVISPAVLAMPLSPDFIYFDDLGVPAGGFSTIYAFGDSLSDAGNISVATLGQLPASPYSDGRFTNGNVWVQDLAQNLGLPAVQPSLGGGTDYAYGGAETGATSAHAAAPIDLPSQLGQFYGDVPAPAANALYTVWAGSNDVLDIANSTETAPQQAASVQQAVDNETRFIDGLVAHGAKDLLVMGVPDLAATPRETANPATDAVSGTLAQTYNSELGTALQQIVAAGDASIDYVNTFAILQQAAANPASYGLTNVTQPVWTGGFTPGSGGSLAAAGAAQNNYLFFDGLHPTAEGHALLASAATKTLTGTA